MDHIVLEKIPHKRIRTFIQEQIENDVQSVKDLEVSFNLGDSTKEFRKHEKIFLANHNIEDVWNFYNTTGPNKVFKDKLVSFSLMLSKKKESEVLYKDEPFSKAEIGQVYFMNLNIFKGLLQIAVSYEIVEINEVEKKITFSYIKGGKSIGFQQIYMKSLGDNETQIIHTTYYRSNSIMRDRYMYPYFHSKVLKEYHSSMIDFMRVKLSN